MTVQVLEFSEQKIMEEPMGNFFPRRYNLKKNFNTLNSYSNIIRYSIKIKILFQLKKK